MMINKSKMKKEKIRCKWKMSYFTYPRTSDLNGKMLSNSLAIFYPNFPIPQKLSKIEQSIK